MRHGEEAEHIEDVNQEDMCDEFFEDFESEFEVDSLCV